MQVKLVSTTEPKVDSVIATAEDLIVYCARVSNPSNQLNVQTAPKLIKYLIEHAHWSPFEMVSMCVEVKTSRAIAAQILRHRSFSFQEFSQRYSTATELERIELRRQGKTNRQVGDEPLNISEHIEIFEDIDALQHQSIKLYEKLIERGIAKECARMILPLNTSTTILMSGTIRSWIHYFQIRTEKGTQKEHRDIALAIQKIFIEQFPNISSALGWRD
jgi:thymidylate synthase (FAD)